MKNRPVKVLSASLFRVILNRFGVISLGLMIVEQAIVAISTYWIAAFGYSVAEGQASFLYFSLFVVSLLIVYIPGTISLVFLEFWRMHLYRHYVMAFSEAHAGRVDLWQDRQVEADRSVFLYSEGPDSISASLGFLFDLIRTTLNVLLNVAVLGIVIHPMIALGFAVGAIIIVIISFTSYGRLSQLSSVNQVARTGLTQRLAGAWNTLVVSNTYNTAILQRRLEEGFRAETRASVREVATAQGVSTLMAVCAGAPVFGAAGYLVATSDGTDGLMGEIAATLPRMMFVVHHTQVVASYLTQLPGLRARLKGLSDRLLAPATRSLTDRVAWDQIVVRSDGELLPAKSLEDLVDAIADLQPRRITIRGPNGSGKTAALLELKRLFGPRAVYLPAASGLAFEADHDKLSTGQRLIATLTELRANADVPLVLLDEWDANLDPRAVDRVSGMVEDWGRRACVIEARHRGS